MAAILLESEVKLVYDQIECETRRHRRALHFGTGRIVVKCEGFNAAVCKSNPKEQVPSQRFA